MTETDHTDNRDLANIRIYTNGIINELIVENKQLIVDDDGDKFYTVTPKQFVGIVTDRKISKNLLMLFEEPDNKQIEYLITKTNIETVKLYCDTLEDNGIYDDFSLYDYIGEAIVSEDSRMWKYVLDVYNHNPDIDYPDCIHSIIYKSTADSLLDGFINVCVHIQLDNKLNDQSFINSMYAMNLVHFCIANHNYKILKYLLDMCAKHNTNLDAAKCILPAILKDNFEFVDLLLQYCVQPMITENSCKDFDYENIKLGSVQFLHQLYMDSRIDISDKTISKMISKSWIKHNMVVFMYLVTAFPYVLKSVAPIVYVGSKYIKEIEMINEELLREL